MKISLKILALGAVVAAAPLAFASTILGSDALTFTNVYAVPLSTTVNPISGVTDFTMTGGLTTSPGQQNLSVIPDGNAVTESATFYPSGALGEANPATPFTFTIAGFGTFTETAAPVVTSNAGDNNTSNVNFYLLGSFAPGAGLSTFSTGPASFTFSVTESVVNGIGSYSASGTLASPPATVSSAPEPSSLVLLGTGLCSAAGMLVRRRRMVA
jgi:hypothetical protein